MVQQTKKVLCATHHCKTLWICELKASGSASAKPCPLKCFIPPQSLIMEITIKLWGIVKRVGGMAWLEFGLKLSFYIFTVMCGA